MAVISVEQLSKHFGDVVAVDAVDLSISDGEFMVLVGPSGCGKTTLLRMIAGLAEPTAGSIRFDDEEVTHEAPGQRNVAMVFQNYALFPHMTVERNLSFGLRLRHTRGPERRERVAQVAQLLRIEELLTRFPRELSGGQKQRVALGRALIRQPVAFLFDEPLSNLDPALRVEMRAEIAQLHRDYPITTVYVTHDQVEAMTMGDRIAVMNHGCIRQVGEPNRVYHDPDDLFTASFIGSPTLNQLPVALKQDGELVRFNGPDGETLFVERATLGVAGELPANAVLGIRPEHLSLCAPDAENALGAEVYLVEELGREHIVHLEREGRQLRAVGQLQDPPRLGELAHVRPSGTIFIFDAETETRIR